MPGLLLLDCAAGELLLLLGLPPACSSAFPRAIGLRRPPPAVTGMNMCVFGHRASM
jgi:hypothetical protein